ncbi:MAG: type II secretion system F family protein [Eggerthellaceae bacterium]|nr:type II secretion system F family protein [Eggerthellaceae bacterium]
MARKNMESGAVSVFCESIAVMLGAGIQTEDALGLLSENTNDAAFQSTCDGVYRGLIEQKPLADAMEATGTFPAFAIDMVRTGENSGRLEATLSSLARYYNEEDRLISKLHSSIVYPVALFALMSIILLFTLIVIIPIFMDTYTKVSGGLGTGPYTFVAASLVIGWIAFVLALLGTIFTFAIANMTRSQKNLRGLEKMLEKLPFTREAAKQLALSRFTSVLTSYAAIGAPNDVALEEAAKTVDSAQLRTKLDAAVAQMQDPANPKSLSRALGDNDIYGPVYTRMMTVGDTSGNLEEILDSMSNTFFEDALIQMDESMDRIEPALAAFLTITVGATLIAVMVPLIGILGSIG